MPSCTVRFIYIPKKLGLCRLSLCSLMMCAYNRVHYGPMVVFLCLNIKLHHYHHYADISEGIELLKCLSVNSVSRVCLRFSQFSQLSFMQYMGLCLLSLHISLMIVRIRMLYLIFIIKSEVCSIRHCLGLDNETMVCAVCLFIFLQDYGVSSPLAIQTPQSYTWPFKKCWILASHGFVTGFQLKAHKLFAKWAIEAWINECESTGFNCLVFWTDSWFL